MDIYAVVITETDGTSSTTINAFTTEEKAKTFFESQKKMYIDDCGCGNSGVIEDNGDKYFYWAAEEGFNDETIEIEIRTITLE